jgi:hypothetical protein
MRRRAFGGLDGLTLALLLAGAACVAFAFVGVFVLISPPGTSAPRQAAATPPAQPGQAGEVATVLYVDAAAGAGSAARAGDHIDILGYFPAAASGSQSLTRLLLQDVSVLSVARTGNTVALTLGVSQAAAVMLQEAQALGGRPYIALRSAESTAQADDMPSSFSDADLAARIGASKLGASPSNGRLGASPSNGR